MSDFDLEVQVRSIALVGPAKQVHSVVLCTPRLCHRCAADLSRADLCPIST